MNDFSMVAMFLEALLAEERYDSFVAFFTSWAGSVQLGLKLRTAIAEGTTARAGRPAALVILADEAIIADYEAAGFLVFDDPTRAVQTLARMAAISSRFDRAESGTLVAAAHELPPFPLQAISESAGKAILNAIGIPVLLERLAVDADAAADAAEAFAAPLAIKLVSPDVTHKTEVGGVKLNVSGGQAAREAFDAIVASATRLAPRAHEGVSISPMAGSGVELIVGVRYDATFGPVTMVGMGGLFVEVMNDVAIRVGAVSPRRRAEEMIRSLAGYPLLGGARGRPCLDVAAAADAVSRLSAYGVHHAAHLDSIEINPLLVKQQGVYALDALFCARSIDG